MPSRDLTDVTLESDDDDESIMVKEVIFCHVLPVAIFFKCANMMICC